MPAVNYNVLIEQGADWDLVVEWQNPSGTPIPVNGYSAKLQIRTSALAKTAVLTLTDGAGITINGALGKFTIHATATQTGNITNGQYVYDMEITSPTQNVTRLIEGKATVSAQVTR